MSYRQGKSLGEQHKHWFRATFFQQYHLFFRYHAASRIIVYAWVNDNQDLKGLREQKAMLTGFFARMLDSGNPPDDWESLLREAKRAKERFRRGS